MNQMPIILIFMVFCLTLIAIFAISHKNDDVAKEAVTALSKLGHNLTNLIVWNSPSDEDESSTNTDVANEDQSPIS